MAAARKSLIAAVSAVTAAEDELAQLLAPIAGAMQSKRLPTLAYKLRWRGVVLTAKEAADTLLACDKVRSSVLLSALHTCIALCMQLLLTLATPASFNE